MPMAIEFRIELHGVEADLISYARGIYRLERRDGRSKICDLSTIYERDTLIPVMPGELIPLDRERLAQLPTSYRMLAYYFTSRQYDIDPNMPAEDQPESADRVLAEAFEWVNE